MPPAPQRGRSTLPRVLVVGLGPAGPEYWTEAVCAALGSEQTVLLRTARHPGTASLLAKGASSLDHCYEQAANFVEAYEAIVEEVVGAATAAGQLCYAVPGSPFVLESTVQALRADARVEVEVLPGMSFLDLCWARLGIDPLQSAVRLLDGECFALAGADGTGAMLVAQLWSKTALSELKLAFEDPPERAVLLHHLGLSDEQVVEVAFSDLDRTLDPDHLTCVYLPQVCEPAGAQLARLLEVVATLRLSCPWDRVQTHASLVRHLIEETYEAIEAIDELGDPPRLDRAEHLEEELGDVLCQVLFHAAIAQEEGLFSFADVARTLREKLVRRHPHVFSPDPAHPGALDAVLLGWERAKQEEKGRTSVMEGIAPGLPALALAEKIHRRASAVAGVGSFEQPATIELSEAFAAFSSGDLEATGPLLFAIAAIASSAGVSSEDVLRRHAHQRRETVIAAEKATAEPS